MANPVVGDGMVAGKLSEKTRTCAAAGDAVIHAATKIDAAITMRWSEPWQDASCWDNAVAESFFATIKGELFEHEGFQARAEATAATAEHIDGFYNVQGMHSSISYMSPIELELQLISKAA